MLVALAVLVATDDKVGLAEIGLAEIRLVKIGLAWALIPQCTRRFQTPLDLYE